VPRNVLKSTDEVDCGILEIDWRNHSWTVHGIGGRAGARMTAAQVLRELKRRPEPGVALMAVVAWKENTDGYQQLCFYDRSIYEEEVYGPP
jgi:hypothetical protein